MRADFPSRAHHRCKGAVKGLSRSRALGFWIRPECFKLRFLFHIAQNLFSDHGILVKSKRGMSAKGGRFVPPPILRLGTRSGSSSEGDLNRSLGFSACFLFLLWFLVLDTAGLSTGLFTLLGSRLESEREAERNRLKSPTSRNRHMGERDKCSFISLSAFWSP